MSLFEIIACVAFVLGLINAFFLLSLAQNFDRDLSELDSRKVNNKDFESHKKIMRQSLQVIHDDQRASMKRMQQKFNTVNAKVTRKKKARVVFFDKTNDKNGGTEK